MRDALLAFVEYIYFLFYDPHNRDIDKLSYFFPNYPSPNSDIIETNISTNIDQFPQAGDL